MKPFRTRPIFKDKVWAGGRLQHHVTGAGSEAGEAWLVSDVAGDSSEVLDGPHAGATLRELVRDHPAGLLGPGLASSGEQRFPLLVKLLDMQTPLSVQLHPDGPTARSLGDGERGKCESWLVLEAGPEAKAWLGVPPETPAAELLDAARAGKLQDLLSTRTPAVGEGFPILPGTLHTAQDLVVLEVQETSDITYRVFDWGRGRELHLDAARAVLERLGPQGSPPREDQPGWRSGARALGSGCPFRFEAVQLDSSGRWVLPRGDGPQVVVALGPDPLDLATDGNPALRLGVGEAAVIPAQSSGGLLHGSAGGRLGWAASYVG